MGNEAADVEFEVVDANDDNKSISIVPRLFHWAIYALSW